MQIFFEPASYELANGKWISSYNKIIRDGADTSFQENSWDKQFDSEEEANKYAVDYCLQQGYLMMNKK